MANQPAASTSFRLTTVPAVLISECPIRRPSTIDLLYTTCSTWSDVRTTLGATVQLTVPFDTLFQ